MASMQYLFDESTWVSPDSGKGTSPIDSSYCGVDLLSGKLLAYWDFIIANALWHNSVHQEALESVKGLAFEHNKPSAIGELDVLLKSVLSHARSSALERAEQPPQRSRALWAEAVGPVGRS
eukprot:1402435-Rhodomonas_salina.1